MGWTTHCNETREDIIRYLTGDKPGDEPAVLKSTVEGWRSVCLAKSVKSNHLFAVIEKTEPGKSTERWIMVCLIGADRAAGGYGYKEMCESMGPSEVDCPLKFLDMVPEPANNYGWRDKVRAYHAQKAAREAKCRAITVGATLVLVEGCNPPRVVCTSVKPLLGDAGGRTYRVSRTHVAEVLP